MKATAGIWLSAVVVTAATKLAFDLAIPDAPLTGVALVFAGLFWLLVAFGVRWAWKRHGAKDEKK